MWYWHTPIGLFPSFKLNIKTELLSFVFKLEAVPLGKLKRQKYVNSLAGKLEIMNVFDIYRTGWCLILVELILMSICVCVCLF